MGWPMRAIKGWVWVLAGVWLALGGMPLRAESHSHFDADQMQVLELMRQETEKLLRPVAKAPPAVAPPVVDTLYLKAVYGVGKRLLAEVHWNGQDYLYLKGQTWPLGHAQQKNLRLVKMAGRCITLAQQETQHHLCVNTPGAEP